MFPIPPRRIKFLEAPCFAWLPKKPMVWGAVKHTFVCKVELELLKRCPFSGHDFALIQLFTRAI